MVIEASLPHTSYLINTCRPSVSTVSGWNITQFLPVGPRVSQGVPVGQWPEVPPQLYSAEPNCEIGRIHLNSHSSALPALYARVLQALHHQGEAGHHNPLVRNTIDCAISASKNSG